MVLEYTVYHGTRVLPRYYEGVWGTMVRASSSPYQGIAILEYHATTGENATMKGVGSRQGKAMVGTMVAWYQRYSSTMVRTTVRTRFP
jgi:hypothetical protein